MEANDMWRHKIDHGIHYHTLPCEEAEEGAKNDEAENTTNPKVSAGGR